jgi:hypothetical protein
VYSSPGSNKFVSPVYSLPRSKDSLEYSTQGITDRPVYSLPGSSDSPVFHYRGVLTPWCFTTREPTLPVVTTGRGVVFTVLSCFKGLPSPLKE